MRISISRVRSALAVGLVFGLTAAQAAGQTYDTTSVTDALAAAGAAIAVVGSAYLAMSVGAKVFKWIKTAF